MFCVQPYRIKRAKLVAAGALVFQDRDVALAAGRRLAKLRAGIVVLSQTVDASSGRWVLPQILAIHGQVPPSWRERSPTRDVG